MKPKDLNEVYEAAKRGDEVRFLGDMVRSNDFGEIYIFPDPLHILPIDADTFVMDNWEIEEKCPHEEGSLAWAFWQGERGNTLKHAKWPRARYRIDKGNLKSDPDGDCVLCEHFLTGWSLAEEGK